MRPIDEPGAPAFVVAPPRPLAPIEPEVAEQDLPFPVGVRRSLARTVIALRWTVLLVGLVLSTTPVSDGSYRPVWATAICVFLTSLRTMRPVPMGAADAGYRLQAVADGAVFGLACGVSDGLASPFVFCLLGAAAVATFGWGVQVGASSLGAGIVGIILGAVLSGGSTGLDERAGQIASVSVLLALGILAVVRARLLELERGRAALAGQLDALEETNDLLVVLNRVARTLPATLDLGGALDATERQIRETFQPRAFVLIVPNEGTETWIPLRSGGAPTPLEFAEDDLPWLASLARDADGAVYVSRLGSKAVSGTDGSGMATRLRHGDAEVGVLALEHATPGFYDERQATLLNGLADAVALSIDNARQFDRLRLLAANEERTRIARELHDRLGQWLTFIGLELERIELATAPGEENRDLVELRGTVSQAVDAFRETLRGLRTAVTEDRPLAIVAREVTEDFGARTRIHTLYNDRSLERLSAPVENEVLRILQEALHNVSQHAAAAGVEVTWETDTMGGTLRVSDDGCGFDPRLAGQGSYGVQGMRERATAIGGRMEIDTEPGGGTRLHLSVPREVRP